MNNGDFESWTCSSRNFIHSLKQDAETLSRSDIADALSNLVVEYLHLVSETDPTFLKYSVYDGWTGVHFLMKQLLATDLSLNRSALEKTAEVSLRHALSQIHLRSTTSVSDLMRRARNKPSCLLGCAGPLLLSLMTENESGSAAAARHSENLLIALANEPCPENELFNGRAGLLSALLLLQRHQSSNNQSESESLLNAINHLATELLLQGSRSGSDVLSYSWHDKKYFGAAHGLCGILHTLMGAPATRQSPNVRATIDYLCGFVGKHGSFPSRANGSSSLCQWCHGPPAIVPLLCSAYRLYGDTRYLDLASTAADYVWRNGVLLKGANLCHGTAGNAFAFLSLFRARGADIDLVRAHQFARVSLDPGYRRFIRLNKTEAGTAQPLGLWTSHLAGSIVLLIALLDPKNATLPLFYEF